MFGHVQDQLVSHHGLQDFGSDRGEAHWPVISGALSVTLFVIGMTFPVLQSRGIIPESNDFLNNVHKGIARALAVTEGSRMDGVVSV